MGEVVIGLSNWGRSNRESLIKLKVIVYEALSYQDESYIPLYKEAMGELINEY